LAAVPGFARWGISHHLAAILDLAVCAVLAGARSFTAIAERAGDADQATWDAPGVTGAVPCGSAFRQAVQDLGADGLDGAAGARAQQRTARLWCAKLPRRSARSAPVNGRAGRGCRRDW